jgi:hypothetical protein
MSGFNHKMQPFLEYRITLLGPDETRSRLTKRLEKVFERRRSSDSTAEDGTRTITFRDETVIRMRPKKGNGAFSSLRRPFLELEVRTTEEYKNRSVAAMNKYAQSLDLPFFVDVAEVQNEKGRESTVRPPV